MKLPDSDEHFRRYVQKGNYQRYMLCRTMSYSKSWKTALDIGAHVGFTASDLAKFFQRVHAFEPQAENYQCLLHNVPDNVIAHNVAVGFEPRMVAMVNPVPSNSGAWEVRDGNDIQMVSIDSLDFQDVSLVKIDVQDGELEVLKGAADTLKRWKPVMQVEIPKAELRGDMIPHAVKFLNKLGAQVVDRIREDIVFAW